MGHKGCLMCCQITVDEEGRACQRTVVVQHPSVIFSQSGLFLRTAPTEALKLLGTNVCLPSDHMVKFNDG